MASHHHHHCHNPTMAATAAPPCHCTCTYSPLHHHPPQPDPHYLNPNHYHHSPSPDLHQHLYTSQTHLPNLHQYDPCLEKRVFREETQINHTISSLVRRIAALESALIHRSSSSSRSLRDAAARTIQFHFRGFLLRRSRTLRQLKNLASIKSTLNILKSSVSEKVHFDYNLVYQKVISLRQRLNSIQSGDTMIRDGKSSINRELNRFMDFIDGFCLENRIVSLRYEMNNVKLRGSNGEGKSRNVKNRGLRKGDEEELRGLSERIDKLAEDLDEESESPKRKQNIVGKRNGVLVNRNGAAKPKGNKSVSFVENGKVYTLFRKNVDPLCDVDLDVENTDAGDFVFARDFKDACFREVEEIGVSSKKADVDEDEEEAHSDDGDSLPSSEGGEESRSYSKRLR